MWPVCMKMRKVSEMRRVSLLLSTALRLVLGMTLKEYKGVTQAVVIHVFGCSRGNTHTTSRHNKERLLSQMTLIKEVYKVKILRDSEMTSIFQVLLHKYK